MKKVLEVKAIKKSYRKHPSLLSMLFTWFGIKKNRQNDIVALENIDFTVYAGETIGLIGRNGAGKSTLLKIITGTASATEGSIKVNGKISAILELGLGFNPELTGRQNVYHSAAIMGISKKKIDSEIEKIAEFAEIGDYFDMPSRIYSSGMQARVAFSVATAFKPDILIVDEALSVGDIYFQHKSFARIRELQEDGTALLIVSHDQYAINSICNRAILIENGVILKDGSTQAVTDYYNALIAEKEGQNTIEQYEISIDSVKTKSGTGEATVTQLFFEDEFGKKTENIQIGEIATLVAKVNINESIEKLVFGFMIKDKMGRSIYGTNTMMQKAVKSNLQAGDKLEFRVCFEMNIGVGGYSISTALVDGNTHLDKNYEWVDLALIFNVANSNESDFTGCCYLKPNIKVSKE